MNSQPVMGQTRHGDCHRFAVQWDVPGGDNTGMAKLRQVRNSPNRIMAGIVLLLLLGCSTTAQKAAEQKQRYTAAKGLFERAENKYHLPIRTI